MKEYLLVVVVSLFLVFPVFPAQEDNTTRRLWDTAFITQPGKRTSVGAAAKRKYRIATPTIRPSHVSGETVLGITLWRLRPSSASVNGERLLVQEGPEAVDWIPERVEADTKLAPGTRVRLGIEAARLGYLYVIDREQYADGSLGEPYLIFPTTRTNNGNNEVREGRIVEIPAQDDRPPFFTLKPTGSNQVSEVISVLVCPTPLEGLQIGDKAQKLSTAQVAAWEKAWGGRFGRLELEDGAGKTWTRQERDAGADMSRSLSQEEPPPQTLFYAPDRRAGQPIMVNVHLQYGRASSAARNRRPRAGLRSRFAAAALRKRFGC